MEIENSFGALFEIPVRATVPIFSIQNGRTRNVASGLLFLSATRLYLITATHVLVDPECPRDSLFFVDAHNNRLHCHEYLMSLMTTPDSEFGSDKDRADVSVLELHGHSRSDFSQLILNQTYCYLPAAISDELDILLSGFPYAPNIDTDERTVTLRNYLYHTRILATESRAVKAGYLPGFHHVVEYRRRDINSTTGERVLTPEPYGLSGGGMWVLSTDAEGRRSYRLIGVNIEYYRDSSVIAAVQINHVLRFMKPIDDLRAASGQ